MCAFFDCLMLDGSLNLPVQNEREKSRAENCLHITFFFGMAGANITKKTDWIAQFRKNRSFFFECVVLRTILILNGRDKKKQ